MQMVDADYFSDEPMSYALSRHILHAPDNVRDVDGTGSWHYPRSWYLERPGFYLAMTPAALISFTAYRVQYILVAAALAPMGAWLLRALNVRAAFAYPAGVVLAVHPQLVLWGSITHMDTPMTVALAGGFLASMHGRHRLAAALFVLAVWVKETAMAFLVFVLIADVLMEWFRTRRLPWPLQLGGQRSALFAGILFGFIPFMIAQEMWFGLPGESTTGRTREILDGAFLSLWLAPFAVAALLFPRTREQAVWALALPVFYLALHAFFEWNVREWYLVGSAFFTVIACAAVLDELTTRAAVHRRSWTAAPAALGLAILLLFAGVVVLPDSEDKRAYTNPLRKWHSPSLAELFDQHSRRDPEGRALLAAIRDSDIGNILLVDVHYSFGFHPVPTYVDRVRVAHTSEILGGLNQTRVLVSAAETFADVTVVYKRDAPANQAIRAVYADCVVRDEPQFVFLDVRACPGRLDQVYRAIAFPKGGPP